jgi:hypothetical protein
MFEDYLLAVDYPEGDQYMVRKTALLRASLGVEGYRIYSSLVDDPKESYDEAVKHLESHFERKSSQIFQRALFSRRVQTAGETVSQYVASLRELAAKCSFSSTSMDERVRDQLVAWLYDKRMRERLLQEPDTATLQQLVQIAVTLERSMQEAEAPALNTKECVNRVASDNRRETEFVQKSCYACGRVGHLANTSQCPARGRKCNNCGSLNHFAQCCNTRPQRQSRTTTRDRDYATDMKTVHMVNVINQNGNGEFTIRCLLNNELIELMIDLGAKVSLLNWATYERLFRDVIMEKSNIHLKSYEGSDIVSYGTVSLAVRYAGKTVPRFKFHVTQQGKSIIGVDLFDLLGFKVLDPTGVQIAVVNSDNHYNEQLSKVKISDYPNLQKEFNCITGFQHQPMVDKSVRPVRQALRRLPLALRDEVSAELKRMQDLHIIEKIDASPWISNLVIVRKTDKSLRICVDLTNVNKAVIPEVYPLPTLEELTSKLAGATVFSKLDMKWGYLQVPLATESRYLTAFVTHEGVYQFMRLPNGICSAPSAFQQIIKHMLTNIDGVVNLLDDILIYGTTVQEHDKRLAMVLERLNAHQVVLHKDKSVVGVRQINFNGHELSGQGMRPLTSNVDDLSKMTPPVDVKQLRSFIGAIGFYARFVPHYADIIEPLRCLLRLDVPWDWTSDCQRSFEHIIECVSSTATLTHFDPIATTIVTTDASSIALGACLSQVVMGVERPVAFASRVLSPTERNYSASEREALACIWASEKWHFYLYGRKFTLQTDHQALQTLLLAPGTGHKPLRLHRWADRLSQYNFDVRYTSGPKIAVADCLSRMVSDHLINDTYGDEATITVATVFGNSEIAVLSAVDIADATKTDAALSQVIEFVSKGWPAKTLLPEALRSYYDVRNYLSFSDDKVLTHDTCVVIPSTLRQQVLQLVHEGHPGIVRMKQRCRTLVWWPKINNDIESYVRACVPCTVSGKSYKPHSAPLQPIELPPHVWHTISIDIFGEIQWAPSHQRYAIVVSDLYSKWPEVALRGNVTSAVCINALTDIFARNGLPQYCISDNGPQFISAEFRAFLTNLGIQHKLTAVYHPESNATTERFNRVLKEGLTVALAEGTPYAVAVRNILANYRSLPHALMGVSPAKLFLGRDLRMPLDCLRSSMSSTNVRTSSDEQLRERVHDKQQKVKEYVDTRRHAKQPSIVVGDMVRTKLPWKSHKCSQTWSSDSRTVTSINGPTVTLDNGQKWNCSKCLVCPRDSDNFIYAEYECVDPDNNPNSVVETDCQSASPPVRHSGRIIRAPNRYSQ